MGEEGRWRSFKRYVLKEVLEEDCGISLNVGGKIYDFKPSDGGKQELRAGN